MMDKIDARLERLETDVSDVKADLRLLRWMTGFVLAAVMAVLWLLLRSR